MEEFVTLSNEWLALTDWSFNVPADAHWTLFKASKGRSALGKVYDFFENPQLKQARTEYINGLESALEEVRAVAPQNVRLDNPLMVDEPSNPTLDKAPKRRALVTTALVPKERLATISEDRDEDGTMWGVQYQTRGPYCSSSRILLGGGV